ncbi:hydrogenase expression/formation protein HypE [candidate division KSB1 bacterium]|nr:hydrogenase expression/formation protein HypE [candidate division KSB1 bacterium]
MTEKTGHIKLSHGSGGKISHDLIQTIFLPYFNNHYLERLDDSAVLESWNGKIALTTDSYVVDPIIFPGGDIGKLAVSGTINDLVVKGAEPLYLTAGFILEEGLTLSLLEQIVQSMAETATTAGVKIVTGDTKVVPKGSADKLFINTSGIGRIANGLSWGISEIVPGDDILLNGNIGEHGLSVLLAREDYGLVTDIQSDVNPLSELVGLVRNEKFRIHAMRDPTRGGLATTLNEMAQAADFNFVIQERYIPLSGAVYSACQMLGLDALSIANEGKVVIVVDSADSEKVLETLRSHPLGQNAAKIGTVMDGSGQVIMNTRIGGRRLVDLPLGELLPRIC